MSVHDMFNREQNRNPRHYGFWRDKGEASIIFTVGKHILDVRQFIEEADENKMRYRPILTVQRRRSHRSFLGRYADLPFFIFFMRDEESYLHVADNGITHRHHIATGNEVLVGTMCTVTREIAESRKVYYYDPTFGSYHAT